MKKMSSYELLITLEDKNLIEVSKKFLQELETKFKNFNREYEKYKKENEKYLNNKNYVFEPEKIVKVSPMTIIDAPWGTGKTFFIENLIKLLIDKKIKSKIFKKNINYWCLKIFKFKRCTFWICYWTFK